MESNLSYTALMSGIGVGIVLTAIVLVVRLRLLVVLLWTAFTILYPGDVPDVVAYMKPIAAFLDEAVFRGGVVAGAAVVVLLWGLRRPSTG
jgi:hypothetical protein